MTRDDVIRWAREIGAPDWWMGIGINGEVSGHSLDWLWNISTMAAEAEREACAKVCDRFAVALDYGGNEYLRSRDCQLAANAIRSQGAAS